VTSLPPAGIVGVAEGGISFASGKRGLELAAEVAVAAVQDAGLALDDIDGLAVAKGGDLAPADRPSLELAEVLGIRLAYMDTTVAGGASSFIQLGHALTALALGRCARVLIVYGSAQRTQQHRSLAGHARPGGDPIAAAERSAGLPQPLGVSALAAARHMFEFGTTAEQLASVAVSDRAWAELNPAALRRKPLTVEDVLASPMIASPLHRDECALVSDGAAALVLDARPSAQAAVVRVIGYGEVHTHNTLFGASSLTATAAGQSVRDAMTEAGVKLADIDLVGLYDAFAILPIVLLEDLGFCRKGDGGRFVADGHTMPGGDLPMNTQGGGLSHCHPGYYGMFLLVEAVRQLRGACGGRQVPDANIALCHASTTAFGGSNVSAILAGE